MKFWNKTYGELTVKELTIWGIVVSVIFTAITWIGMCTNWFETAAEKITGIWNKIFHR